MKEKVIIQNCVKAETIITRVYPQDSDYGCLANAISIAYEDGDKYVERDFLVEELMGLTAYEVEIKSWGNVGRYKNYLISKYVVKMKKDGFNCWLEVKNNNLPIRLRVVKGRNYPKGLEFNSTNAIKYETRGTTIYYINGIDDEDNKIHINCDNVEFVSIMEVK